MCLSCIHLHTICHLVHTDRMHCCCFAAACSCYVCPIPGYSASLITHHIWVQTKGTPIKGACALLVRMPAVPASAAAAAAAAAAVADSPQCILVPHCCHLLGVRSTPKSCFAVCDSVKAPSLVPHMHAWSTLLRGWPLDMPSSTLAFGSCLHHICLHNSCWLDLSPIACLGSSVRAARSILCRHPLQHPVWPCPC